MGAPGTLKPGPAYSLCERRSRPTGWKALLRSDTPGLVFLQTFPDNIAQVYRHGRAHRDRARLLRQDCRKRVAPLGPGEWMLADEQLIKQNPEAEYVASRVRLFTASLLRRHVTKGANDNARVCCRPTVTASGASKPVLPAIPKSRTFTRSPAVSMMFCGLISRCTIPSLWASARASAICVPYRSVSACGSRPGSSSPPASHLRKTP